MAMWDMVCRCYSVHVLLSDVGCSRTDFLRYHADVRTCRTHPLPSHFRTPCTTPLLYTKRRRGGDYVGRARAWNPRVVTDAAAFAREELRAFCCRTNAATTCGMVWVARWYTTPVRARFLSVGCVFCVCCLHLLLRHRTT